MTQQQALYRYCLRLGDNALILSHRLSEWCGKGPILEEDLALTNFALDMLGRAGALLSYAGELGPQQRSADDLAYRRGEREFLNNLIVELPNGDFAFTIARLLFVSAFEYYFFTELQNSSDERLSAIAAKTLKEVRYHLAHASDWAVRLGDGTSDSYLRMQLAVNDIWMYTGELFEMDKVDDSLVTSGVAVDLAKIKSHWYDHVVNVLNTAKISVPAEGYAQSGSRKGIHTEHLGYILAEMQYLPRAYPDAVW